MIFHEYKLVLLSISSSMLLVTCLATSSHNMLSTSIKRSWIRIHHVKAACTTGASSSKKTLRIWAIFLFFCWANAWHTKDKDRFSM